jgi:hypothetical protein
MALHDDATGTNVKTSGLFLLHSVCIMYSFFCWVHGFCSAFGAFVSNVSLYLANCMAVAYLRLLLQYRQFSMPRNNNAGTKRSTTTISSLMDLSSCSWRLELSHEVRACQAIQKCIRRRFHNALLTLKHATAQTILLVQEPTWTEQFFPYRIQMYTSMPKYLAIIVQWVVAIFLERQSQRNHVKGNNAPPPYVSNVFGFACVRQKEQKSYGPTISKSAFAVGCTFFYSTYTEEVHSFLDSTCHEAKTCPESKHYPPKSNSTSRRSGWILSSP